MAPKRKASDKPVRGQPGAKKQAKSQASHSVANPPADSFTDSVFSLEHFIEEVWRCGGYEAASRCGKAVVASSICSGTNSFGITLQAMLKCAGEVKLRHLFGSENDKGAQHFILRNTSPHCLFEVAWQVFKSQLTILPRILPLPAGHGAQIKQAKDARDVTTVSCPPCATHAKCCRVPAEAEDVCQSGFSCKMNSRQNPKRFAQDIIANPDPEHAASWEATKMHLGIRKPKFGLLENSAGLLCSPQFFRSW